jgi:plastocyanin
MFGYSKATIIGMFAFLIVASACLSSGTGAAQPIAPFGSITTVPSPIQGIPSPIQGIPSPIQGIPSPIQGIPSPIQGIPSPIQGIPTPIPLTTIPTPIPLTTIPTPIPLTTIPFPHFGGQPNATSPFSTQGEVVLYVFQLLQSQSQLQQQQLQALQQFQQQQLQQSQFQQQQLQFQQQQLQQLQFQQQLQQSQQGYPAKSSDMNLTKITGQNASIPRTGTINETSVAGLMGQLQFQQRQLQQSLQFQQQQLQQLQQSLQFQQQQLQQLQQQRQPMQQYLTPGYPIPYPSSLLPPSNGKTTTNASYYNQQKEIPKIQPLSQEEQLQQIHRLQLEIQRLQLQKMLQKVPIPINSSNNYSVTQNIAALDNNLKKELSKNNTSQNQIVNSTVFPASFLKQLVQQEPIPINSSNNDSVKEMTIEPTVKQIKSMPTDMNATNIYKNHSMVLGPNIKNLIILIPNEAHHGPNEEEESRIIDQSFIPLSTTISSGTTVRWFNADVDHEHKLNLVETNNRSINLLRDQNAFGYNEETSHTFEREGDFGYYDTQKYDEGFQMRGQLKVVDAQLLQSERVDNTIDAVGTFIAPREDVKKYTSDLEDDGLAVYDVHDYKDPSGAQDQSLIVWTSSGLEPENIVERIQDLTLDLPYD